MTNQVNIQELGKSLNRARYVLFDDTSNLFYVWHGGTTVNVIDKTGRTVDMWMEEDNDSDYFLETAVKTSMLKRIMGDYNNGD